jgi:C4-dicarboxylate-specific signal transduction histidine kinase
MLVFIRSKSVPTGHASIPEVLSQTLMLLEGELRKGAIQIKQSIPENLPDIVCSPESLQQILVNLMINARDALSNQLEPQISISARVKDKHIEFTLADNGCGISDEIQNRMFDPFFTTKAPGKGTGLGLSVTRRLIQDSGGSIQFESEPDKGCEVSINFLIYSS